MHAVAWMPSFFSSLPTLKPGVPRSTTSAVIPFSPFAGSVFDVDDGGIGHAAVGDPRFRAVDDVAVALAHGFGRERRRVRARLRLGQRVAADFFAAREGHQKFFLLFFRAEAMDRIAVQRILHGEDHAGGSAHAGNFFDDDGIGDVVEPRAAFDSGSATAVRPSSAALRNVSRGKCPVSSISARAASLRFRRTPAPCAAAMLFFGESRIQRLRSNVPRFRRDAYEDANAKF